MKYFSLFLISLLFIGCDNSEEVETTSNLVGAWTLVSQSYKKESQKLGLLFSSDYQYFDLDSQGQTISRFRPKYWHYANDTLILVNTNIEPHLLDTKGTKKFIVDELTEDLLKIRTVGEDYEISYFYQKK